VSTVVFLLVLAAAPPAVPPRLDVREALAQGRAAFIGRVTRIEELERTRHETEAVLDVEIVRCLYGSGCEPGRPMSFHFLAQTLEAGVWPVEFVLAEEDLFVLEASPDPDASYRFDSEPRNGFDLSFRGAKVPKRKGDGDSVNYTSVYGGEPQTVRKADLDAWASARSRQLQPGEDAPSAAEIPPTPNPKPDAKR